MDIVHDKPPDLDLYVGEGGGVDGLRLWTKELLASVQEEDGGVEEALRPFTTLESSGKLRRRLQQLERRLRLVLPIPWVC